MNYLLYQAYGKQEIIYEAIYSILSCLQTIPENGRHDFAIVIYTDQEEMFEKIFTPQDNIVYETVSAAKIKEWRGGIDFVHRVKIKVLQDFFLKYGGNVLYVDTDTYFFRDVREVFQKIGEKQLFMHVCEGVISKMGVPLSKKIQKFINRHEFVLEDGTQVRVPDSTRMWNAGAIGMNVVYKPLLEQVLQLTDAMYRLYPKHVMEQLSFSWFFQNAGQINELEGYIFHYWNFKEFREVLSPFFQQSDGLQSGEMISHISKINPMQLIKPKLDYQKLPFWRKWLRKIRGKKWEMVVK